jgi:hypothetical protein
MNLHYNDSLQDFLNDIRESGKIYTQSLEDERLAVCPSCGDPLYPIYENNGFDPSEGPTMIEHTGDECKNPDCERNV